MKKRPIKQQVRRSRAAKPESETASVDEIQKRVSIVISLIADTRSFTFDFLKLYSAASITLNGGAIIYLFKILPNNYFDSVGYFILCILIYVVTVFVMFIVNSIPASYYSNYIFKSNFNIEDLCNKIKFDSKISVCVLYVSLFAHVFCFGFGITKAINVYKNIVQ